MPIDFLFQRIEDARAIRPFDSVADLARRAGLDRGDLQVLAASNALMPGTDVRSWSSNGRSRYTGTLELGQAQPFRARQLWINFGNPGNLSIVLNGKLVSVTRSGSYIVTRRGITRAA